MTPLGDQTKSDMRAIAREEVVGATAGAEESAAREERLERERHSTQIGWALLAVAAFVVLASVASDIIAHRQITFTIPVVTVAVLLAFGGGALVQGVRLDKILSAWKGKDAS